MTEWSSASDSLVAGMSFESPFAGPPPLMTAARNSSERLESAALSVRSVGLVLK